MTFIQGGDSTIQPRPGKAEPHVWQLVGTKSPNTTFQFSDFATWHTLPYTPNLDSAFPYELYDTTEQLFATALTH